MKIRFHEMTIAKQDVEKTNEFYKMLFGPSAEVQHHDFFYTLENSNTNGRVCVVPHNGDSKWDKPWLTVSTDNLKDAIAHIKEIGVAEDGIENFGQEHDNGEPKTGVTFRDPDGRLLMLLHEDEV